jgi:hypothetical protein
MTRRKMEIASKVFIGERKLRVPNEILGPFARFTSIRMKIG